MTNLLPCPFCGGEAIIKNISDTSRPDKDDWWVSCRGCQIERPSAKPNEIVHSRDEAIAAWNRRAPTIPPDVRETLQDAQLAQTWQPDDLSFVCGAATIGQIGNQLLVELYGETLQVDVPDDIRLCRLVERAEPQSNGWKSANESLPEGHAWVLVYADGAIDCMGYSPDKGFEDWTEQRAPNVNISEITHWKELQQPTEVDHE